jgi:hypothetical protein
LLSRRLTGRFVWILPDLELVTLKFGRLNHTKYDLKIILKVREAKPSELFTAINDKQQGT